MSSATFNDYRHPFELRETLIAQTTELMRTPPRLDSSLIGQGLQLYYETSGRKTALLIANGNGGNIQTVCREDAGAMSTVLESLGFIVSLHRDLDSSAILEIAKEFSSSKRTDCFCFTLWAWRS
eukprot:TRINITY_DN2264_c0_g1_i2.p1 TRINITY_DN2264_c0_g1~~TRINITY_DN2264_c0_g1_i2.p1  ORF type:complete len:124 (-),score=15.74 TRINITY_DN2264_c0_g1_i2:568-939(-)